MVSQFQGEVKRKGNFGAIIGGTNQHPALVKIPDVLSDPEYQVSDYQQAFGSLTALVPRI